MPVAIDRQDNCAKNFVMQPITESFARQVLLARLYHAHHSLYTEDLPFWEQLARQCLGPVLELGCGTGRVLLQLIRSGSHVTGLDLSLAQLHVLKEQYYRAFSGRAPVFQADMSAFILQKQFNLILLPCNTLSTLLPAQRQKTLRNTYRQLRTGGLLAASLPNPKQLVRVDPEGESEPEAFIAHPEDGQPVQVSSAWQREGSTFRLVWHYDHLATDGTLSRHSIETLHRLDKLETYRAELSTTGFSEIDVLGDFEGTPYSPGSPEAILLARKG